MSPQSAVYSQAMDHPLSRWRAKHRIDQRELAQQCQLSQQAISAYEQGTRVPRGDALKRLLEVTGIPIEALIFPAEFLEQHPEFPEEPPPEATGRSRPKKPPHRRRPRGE
jgi:transcriptional regulator with XRE-family HTH domain